MTNMSSFHRLNLRWILHGFQFVDEIILQEHLFLKSDFGIDLSLSSPYRRKNTLHRVITSRRDLNRDAFYLFPSEKSGIIFDCNRTFLHQNRYRNRLKSSKSILNLIKTIYIRIESKSKSISKISIAILVQKNPIINHNNLIIFHWVPPCSSRVLRRTSPWPVSTPRIVSIARRTTRKDAIPLHSSSVLHRSTARPSSDQRTV